MTKQYHHSTAFCISKVVFAYTSAFRVVFVYDGNEK